MRAIYTNSPSDVDIDFRFLRMEMVCFQYQEPFNIEFRLLDRVATERSSIIIDHATLRLVLPAQKDVHVAREIASFWPAIPNLSDTVYILLLEAGHGGTALDDFVAEKSWGYPIGTRDEEDRERHRREVERRVLAESLRQQELRDEKEKATIAVLQEAAGMIRQAKSFRVESVDDSISSAKGRAYTPAARPNPETTRPNPTLGDFLRL